MKNSVLVGFYWGCSPLLHVSSCVAGEFCTQCMAGVMAALRHWYATVWSAVLSGWKLTGYFDGVGFGVFRKPVVPMTDGLG